MNTALIGVVAAILVVVPQILVYLLHTLLLISGMKRKQCITTNPSNKISDISFILPVRKEPLEYIEEVVKYISYLGIEDYEVILVSDDEVDVKDELFKLVRKLRNENINVWVIWRSFPRGFRTGAINTGLFASKGRYVYIIDVDTRPEKCFFYHAVSILEENPEVIAVVGRWEPLNTDSRISEALAMGLRFLTRILYYARSRVGLITYPLGTGTLYKSELLKNLFNGWDENRIQDDMELGARIMGSGFKVMYLHDCAIRVENPSTYKAFRIQQSRWAYGALDTALARFGHIIRSKYSIIIKIDALFYLLQYIPQALVFIGTFLMALTTLFISIDFMGIVLPIVLIWLACLIVYTYLMYSICYINGSTWRFTILCGRLSALTTAVSPYIALSSIKALMRIREVYKRTPKGIYQQMYSNLRIPWELVFGIILCITGLSSLLKGVYLTGIWLLLSSSAYFYVVYRFPHDVFYK